MNSFISKRERDTVLILCVAAIFVLAIVYSVYSATTIDSNVNTGGYVQAGDVYASTTVQATGNGIFYASLSAGASTNTPTTTFNVTGSGYLTGGLGVGFATTGAGQIHNTGLTVHESRLGVNGTTSPYQAFGVSGGAAFSNNGTTTISAEPSNAGTAGCVELKSTDSNGPFWVRIYAGRGRTATSTTGVIANAAVIIEPGRCVGP
jgi:hypothetical protein